MSKVDVDDMLKQAIAGTEAEIFNDAVGKEGPSTEGGPGDRTPEEMGLGHEGQVEPAALETDGAEGGTPEGDKPDEGTEGEGTKPQRDPKTGEFVAAKPGEEGAAKPQPDAPVDPKARVPLSELLTERKARQGLEEKLKQSETARAAETEAAKSQFAQLNSRLDQILAGNAQPKPAAPVNPNAPRQPDIFEDPDAFVRNLTATIEGNVAKRYVAADLDRAHREHGEAFDKAFVAITEAGKTNPAVAAEIRQAYQSSTPAADIMAWHNRQEALKTIGNPTEYAKKVEAEITEKLMKDPEFLKRVGDSLRGVTPGQGGTPKPAVRIPPSLASAAGGNGPARNGANAPVDSSERGIFESAFADG